MTDSQQNRDRAAAIYDCLSRSRRRYTLYRLHEAPKPVALADLAEDVADWEVDETGSEIDPETVKDVYMSLYHNHVSKLADADLVRYDQERDEVELLEFPESVASDGPARLLAAEP